MAEGHACGLFLHQNFQTDGGRMCLGFSLFSFADHGSLPEIGNGSGRYGDFFKIVFLPQCAQQCSLLKHVHHEWDGVRADNPSVPVSVSVQSDHFIGPTGVHEIV
ncbi:hypothetical protein AA958_20510 [Streptomyces sp. CNQ-509]|nr:hypothetical protein AA958_20510 [Streptomyces sp. CNQ-509]